MELAKPKSGLTPVISTPESAATFKDDGVQKLLVVGNTGAGKTAQIWTLPGRKFAYIFDPAAMATLKGCPNLDVVRFMPEFSELDATLKGFNKGSRDDKPPGKQPEPLVYQRWVDDLNARSDSNFFAQYDWVIIDSITFLVEAMMDRQLYINNRYGGLTDQSDYRVAGNKVTSNFKTLTSQNINLYVTGHIDTYQDEDTKRIVTQLRLPGRARGMLPIMFSNIWRAYSKTKTEYFLRTHPEPQGFADIRTTLPGLAEDQPVTITDFGNAQRFGIGALLTKNGFRPKATQQATGG
jgi:GTPase SAR1 family protein